MMRPRNFFAFFPLICLLVYVLAPWGSVAAEGIVPLNVAILPPVNTAKYDDAAVIEKMQAKIVRHFRYPYYEFIKPGITLSTAEFMAKNKKKAYDKEVMRRCAEELAVDIVVVAELASVRSHIYRSMFPGGDTYVETYVALNCYTYRAKDDKYDKVRVSERNYDVMVFCRAPDTLIPDLTDEMLAKIPYKTIIKEE